MIATIRKLFNLYPGEGKNSVLFSILGLLWSLGAYCGVTLSDGMFLEHVGANELPKAYLLTALSLFGTALLFLYGFNHFNAFRLYLCTLALGTIGFLLSILFLPKEETGHTAYWLAFKVFCNILMVILTTSFWFFLDQYFNLQNAKRLYSLFNSSIFLGNALGGAFLAFSLRTIGLSGIALAIISLFLASGVWLFFLTRKIKPFLDDTIEGIAAPEKLPFKQIIKGFLSSRFTLLLMTFYFLIQLINVVTEFTYMQSLDAFFDTPRDEAMLEENSLTIFLGTVTSLIALGNMFFGLFFYSRIVSRFGINNIVGISPIFFLFTFSSWQFTDALWVAILGLIVVEGISYTLDENNSNLLLNTVPSKLKNKARVAIDSFFEPLGMLVSALIFLFFTVASKEVGLFLTLFSLIFVLFIRTEYGKAVLKNLLQNAIHFERKTREWIRRMSKREYAIAKFHLLSMLKLRDESVQLFAIEMLLHFDDTKLLPRLLSEASLMSVKGKIKVIRLLANSSFATEFQVFEWLNAQLHKMAVSSLKSSIYFYFASLGQLPSNKLIHELQSKDLTLRGAAMLALKPFDVEKVAPLLESSNENEICMGLTILGLNGDSQDANLIIPFLNHSSPKVQLEAAESLKLLASKELIAHTTTIIDLIKSSPNSSFRVACIEALGKIEDLSFISKIVLASLHLRPQEKRVIESVIANMGSKTITPLLELIIDPNIPDRCRLLAGRTLGKVALPELRSNLFSIIKKEIERAYFYYYHSFMLPSHFKNLSLEMLKQALFTDYESCIDFIIQLLAIAGSLENSEVLSHGLHSSNPKIRGNAIETLERTCDIKIFTYLKPLIDERPIEEKLKMYIKRKLLVVEFEELLDILQKTPTQTNLVIALTLKAELAL